MPQDWLFDVLADLETFGRLNGLTAFAAHVCLARQVAQAELAGQGAPDPCMAARKPGGRPN